MPPPRSGASPCSKGDCAGKHVYSEKPVAPTAAQGAALLEGAQRHGLKHGAVEDKVHLPGLQKLAVLTASGALGRIVGFRLEFGWWVFDGSEQPCQRPSWNYRPGGGGLILDMYPHWRYIIETIVGRIARVASSEWIATPERIDEQGARYAVAVEDSAATLVELEGGAFGTILSSWATTGAARRPPDAAGRRHQRARRSLACTVATFNRHRRRPSPISA
jgi:predicted dehydrogenase